MFGKKHSQSEKEKFAVLGDYLEVIFDTHSEFISSTNESMFTEEGEILSSGNVILGEVATLLKNRCPVKFDDVSYFYAVNNFDRNMRKSKEIHNIDIYREFINLYKNLNTILTMLMFLNRRELTVSELAEALERHNELHSASKSARVFTSESWINGHKDIDKGEILILFSRLSDAYTDVISDENCKYDVRKAFSMWINAMLKRVHVVTDDHYTWYGFKRKKRSDKKWFYYKLFDDGYTPNTLKENGIKGVSFSTSYKWYKLYVAEFGKK